MTVAVKLDTRGGGQVLSVIPSAYLVPGDYRLTISPSIIADRVGNALTAPITLNFTIRPASDIRAASGTPAVATAPSANPGQTIGLPVPFDPATAYATFSTIDANGVAGSVDVKQVRADAAKGTAYFTVPANANTGDVVVYSLVGTTKTSFTDGTFYLQILPTVTAVRVQSVAADGTATVVLTGSGFIEGAATYSFGSTDVVDASKTGGPDVSNYYYSSYNNGSVTLTLPLVSGSFGGVRVTTSGGSSLVYVASLTSVVSAALSGVALDLGVASANPGQAVTLLGSNLSVGTTVVYSYVDYNGASVFGTVAPVSASSDGSQATLVLPNQVNGVTRLQVLGSSSQPLVQIVPVLSGVSASGSTVVVSGLGFVEGASTYRLPGATVVDTSVTAGPDVGYAYSGVTSVSVPVSVFGAGAVTVTTAGGTSAPLASGLVGPGLGNLVDVAVDASGTSVWVVDNASTGRIVKVDVATGATLASIALTAAGFGSTASYAGIGLQVVPSAFTLGTTSVPAGSLLLFDGAPSPDRVVAVNPSTGNTIASLSLGVDYAVSGGAYDPASGHLFVIDGRASPTRVVELNPATAAVVGTFDLPASYSTAGLAVNPVSGSLWYVSDRSDAAYELSRSGVVLRTVSLSLQGVPSGLSGISFDASGTTLFASTSQGFVSTYDLSRDVAATRPATLTGLAGLALDGTPASAAQASANVGQVVTLTGTNFGAGTEVLFATRDNNGVVGLVNQTPLAIDAAGTRLQVLVPNLAATGLVRVVNTGARELGGSSGYADAVYRQVTLSYTPVAGTSTVRFADLGLETAYYESWGIDNVRVAQGGATVFSDDFEGAGRAEWSSAAVDGTAAGVLSRFSGRFNNGAQVLSLSGLAPGQAVTLTFDLYVLDGWDGGAAYNGPDVFQVTADGQVLMSDTFSNSAAGAGATQSYGASAGIRLQIVPTLTASGQPGGDAAFTLTGSGFQDGASTITVGGVVLADTFSGLPTFAVSGSRNDSYRVDAPLTLDGPVKVTTEGGSASVAGPVVAAQPPSLFTAIQAMAAAGVAADAGRASANVGQSIVLVGQGFTSATLVRFSAVDDAGVVGTVTRTGTANAAGTQLTVVVPALARTGGVAVLGSGASVSLQVVPVLRGVGGSVAAGQPVLIDGTGLVGTELTIAVDGRGAGTFAVRTVADVNVYGTSGASQQGQQLLSVTLPAGVTAGVVTVTTAGGSFTLHAGVAVAVAAALAPAADGGDTIAAATAVTLAADSRVTISGRTDDGQAAAGFDVDLYRLTLAAGERLSVGLTGSTYQAVRLFDGAGAQIAVQQASTSGTPPLLATILAAGTYYVGVSGYYNTTYDPAVAGSGTSGAYTGTYQLTLERLGSGDSRVAAITGTATYGTPAQAAVASANTGQTITLTGAGFVTGESVLFSAIDTTGNRSWSQASAASVASDGSSLTVVVPTDATTGTVRLARDPAGVLLQVVPHLTHVDDYAGYAYDGSPLILTGTGFAEGSTTVMFGTTRLNDTSRTDGIDVGYSSYTNTTIGLTVPKGAPTGPIRVTTTGGTSDTAGPEFNTITATATNGTPTTNNAASANQGQIITINGTGLELTTEVVFLVIDGSGLRRQVLVQPKTVDATGTSATVTVPSGAVTGAVRVVGDQNMTSALLQIVPTVTGLTVQSVAADGSSAVVSLTGTGLIEGASDYRFGAVTVPDQSVTQGPEVSSGSVQVTVPLSDGAFGAVVVTTAGGASAPLTASLASITATAGSGTAADAALPSANPGQAVTLNGAGLATSTAVLFHYVDGSGSAKTVVLKPDTAAADGSSATLTVPTYANGRGRLQVFGSATQPVLQIVPVLRGFSASSGTALSLSGLGLVEGATTYSLPGLTVVDTSVTAGADVGPGTYNQVYTDNVAATVPVSAFGAGSVAVTTAGGTSAGLAQNAVNPALGTLFDVAADASGSAIWVADGSSTGKLHKVDLATGATLATIPLTAAGFGTTTSDYRTGLQVVPAAFTLGTTSVPAGSLLLFSGATSPDRVTAVNPATGNTIATLVLGGDYNVSAGVYDKVSGHLFLVDVHVSPTKVLEVNPSTGAVVSSFTAPFNAGEAGLAVNPVSGRLWYASDAGGTAVELTTAGTVLRTAALTEQNVPTRSATGLSFDALGTTLFVSTVSGLVFEVAV